MCGIAGILNLNSDPVNRELLTKITRSLSHRGPDDEGIYVNANLGLGHRRLSIIDLSSHGHQPMSNEEDNLWITYNGEIYNHSLLRQELEKKGHQYKSLTDTESIIHLYEERGIQCLDELDGEFAFCIWDSRKRSLFAARDRLGTKPFYYYFKDKYFIFASEIKALLLHPEVKREVNPQALSHYLSFSVTPAPLTMFKNIFKLEAGHYLIVGADGRLAKRQYWDAISGQKLHRPEEEAIEGIRFRLRESIKERTMSDVPFGVFLSGGIDSSANVAFMSRVIKDPVKAFNVSIEGSRAYSESSFAESVSKHFNSEYNAISINFEDFSRAFKSLAYHTDEPLCDYACIPNFYLAKLARKRGVPVIQVGEGNDEIFCGYKSYTSLLSMIRYYSHLPGPVKRLALDVMKLVSGKIPHHSIEQAAAGGEVFLGTSYLFTEDEKRLLFNDAAELAKLDSSLNYVSGIYADLKMKSPHADALDKITYLDLKVRLPELLLMRADKMSMANSVEVRLPFLDYQFVEFALSLPSKLKIKHNSPKYLYKKSLYGILPKEIILQPKKGFAGNPVNIFDINFKNYLLRTYARVEPGMSQWFKPNAIKEKIDFHPKDMTFREGMKVWSIFCLMLWFEEFF
ncbi:MAG: asparagine synthase (glutamine-hydrolyzing) [Candidatus Omnitrophica bacterium]|nr:asparagine synthase (glutamine-hydrolyzing) [Candidatus Omnitrophota bacterium]MDD5553086.1 asparagine synthase (glutamine-hydrolyzing) [Candidatus Omnitrophota bacterium]